MKKLFYFFTLFSFLLIFTQCKEDENPEPKLEAAVAMDKTTVQAGETITFTNETTGEFTLAKWTFEGGDPETSNELENVTVTYNTTGTFKVTLLVSYKEKSSTAEATIEVVQGPPTAGFSASTTEISPGQTITFTDESEGAENWEWTFTGGEPVTSTGQNPTVTYNTEGVYDVSLKVTNSAGEDTKTETAYITVENVLKANFSMDKDSVERGTTISFSDLSTGDVNSWSWTFPGAEPATSNEQNPTAVFNQVGEIEVTLEVSDGASTETITKTIKVCPPKEEVGLVLYYPLDGDLKDYSGNELHAVELEGAEGGTVSFTTDRHQNSAGALYFPGEPADRKLAPAIQAPDYAYFDGDYTISLWINIEEKTYGTRIFEFGPQTNVNLNMIAFNLDDDDGFMWHHLVNSNVYIDSEGNENKNQMNYPLDNIVGSWALLTFVFTAEGDGTYYLYVNGELKGEGTGGLDFKGALIEDAKIGRGNWDEYNNQPFKGSMDEIRIYDYAISDEVIKILYENYKK